MPLKDLNESALGIAAIAGIAAVAAKLAYDKYKKKKTLEKYGLKSSEEEKELVPIDNKFDAALIGRELSSEYANRSK